MYKKILIIFLLFSSITFSQLNEISVKINKKELLQSKFGSYVYTGFNLSDKQEIKTEIYSFFDASISLNVEDYDPEKQLATNFFFVIYSIWVNYDLKVVP